MHRSIGFRLRWAAIPAALAVIAVSLAACGSDSDSSGTKSVLNVVAASSQTTMNPVLNGTGIPNVFFLSPAYDSLIVRKGDGTLAPGLATKWGYTDDKNQVFEFTLRKNVKFSDGSPLTAEGVKEWINYFRTAPGSLFATQFSDIASVDVVDDYTVRINLSKSDPLWPSNLTQDRYGFVISAKAIKEDPDSLGTSTAGAGPYVLDKSATVTGSKYTYTPNKYYWDKSRIHWSKVVVTVSSDPNSTLSAIQSGQQDFAVGQARSADSAKSAGVQVKAVPYLWDAIVLMDRGGETVPALKDVRVRQALNYAVDRKAIAKAVFGSYAKANVSMVLPGTDGYSDAAENQYDYNPKKAKELLAEAGYADGFTLPMLVYNRNGTDETTFSQALVDYMKAIGVKLELQTGNASTLINDVLAKKYPSWAFFGQTENANQLVKEQLLPDSGVLNPFQTNDANLLGLYDQVSSTTGADQKKAMQELQAYIVDQAYYVPVAISDNVYFLSSKVKGLEVSSMEPIPNIVDLKPAS